MYINIEAERARHKLSLDELSKKIGVERKTLYNWQLNGKIPATALIKMSEVFNCSVDYLLGLTECRTISN